MVGTLLLKFARGQTGMLAEKSVAMVGAGEAGFGGDVADALATVAEEKV